MSDPVATYLKDHHAGATFAIDLLEELRDRKSGEDLGSFAEELLADVVSDLDVLEELIGRTGADDTSITKDVGAWLGEKGARLKLGTPVDGLGTLQTLEVLALGILGKLALWDALAEIAKLDGRFADIDFGRLVDRAREQHAAVEQRRLAAARQITR